MLVQSQHTLGVNMPMYTWRCLDCDKIEYIMSSIAERDSPPEERKIDDHDHKWNRIIDGGSFQLINGGWFKDGY